VRLLAGPTGGWIRSTHRLTKAPERFGVSTIYRCVVRPGRDDALRTFRRHADGYVADVRTVVLLVAVLGLAACSSGDDGDTAVERTTVTVIETVDGIVGGGASARDTFERIPNIVDEVEPSVVTVLVRGSQGEGSGSGVIWDDDGHIVTNNHVVEGAGDVEIALASGTRLDAELVATDPLTDLAVVRVGQRGLPPAEFATSLPDVGALAVALGSPLGLTNTVTAGIVSALHRNLPAGGTQPALVDLVQTDAAISPGNSGGALVDGEGVVIGINVAYLPPESRAVSIGFAIPSPTVRDVVPQLIERGEVEHAFLGIAPAPLTPELAQEFDLGVEEGVIVRELTGGGPAGAAGIRPGDVLVSLDGRPLRTVEDLFAELRRLEPGQRVGVELVRDGQRRELTVRLAERPPS
jgi:serine protease DegQ